MGNHSADVLCHHNRQSLHTTTDAMEICNSPQPSNAAGAEQNAVAWKEHNRVDQRLTALCDISNARCSQLKLHLGSGRAVTRRAYDLALPAIAPPEQQQVQEQIPESVLTALSPVQPTPAASPPVQETPTAALSLAKQHSIKSRKSSCGSAMEGVPERPWRSIGKHSHSSRFMTPGTAPMATPMEGILERFDQPSAAQHSLVQMSQGDSTPAGSSKHEAVLRLQLSPGDEAQLLQQHSPVQGLIEPQLYAAPHDPSSSLYRKGSRGFFGSLNTAPMLFDTPGRLSTSGLSCNSVKQRHCLGSCCSVLQIALS